MKSQLKRKDPDAGKDWRQEKGMTEDEMVGRHHWFNGHEFEQAPGDGEGHRSLVCCSPWGWKESDTTEWLNNNHPTLLTQWVAGVNFRQQPGYTLVPATGNTLPCMLGSLSDQELWRRQPGVDDTLTDQRTLGPGPVLLHWADSIKFQETEKSVWVRLPQRKLPVLNKMILTLTSNPAKFTDL